MHEEIAKKIYNTIINENMSIYKETFEAISYDDFKDAYWIKAVELYQTFNQTEIDIFYDIIKQVIIDTISSVLGLLDGSSSLAGGGTFETEITIDGIDTEHLLQDYFLSIVEEKQNDLSISE